MLIQSASELLAEAEKLAAEAEGQDGEDKEGKEEEGAAASGAADAANGAAEPPSGFEHAEGEAAAAGGGEEEEEEESMTPVQTAQHFAMRNLMNAGGPWGRARRRLVDCLARRLPPRVAASGLPLWCSFASASSGPCAPVRAARRPTLPASPPFRRVCRA